MRRRLEETRALLLAPAGGEEADAWIARDPLRLAQVPWESRAELASGASAAGGGAFVADEGRARLVLAQPRGSAFVSDEARALVDDVERAEAGAALPGVTTELAGGQATAVATEQMLRRDLAVSGTLSLVLASVAFVVTFRRARALAAVLPPLVLGTVWTTGLAALFPAGLNAVAIAFAAVVVGVGVDTGVHVYAAFLAARRLGLAPAAAARRARDDTWRPTLTAAVVAGVAFASLGLSGLRAMQQLGILCGAGELLTAIAIVLVTPEIGIWLERRPPPPARSSRWIEGIVRITSTRPRALVALAVCALPMAAVAVFGWPPPADALVAIRPSTLAPFAAEEHIRAWFGGRPEQWVVLSTGADLEEARTRADRVAEALEPLQRTGTIDGFDALGTFAPSARPSARASPSATRWTCPRAARRSRRRFATQGSMPRPLHQPWRPSPTRRPTSRQPHRYPATCRRGCSLVTRPWTKEARSSPPTCAPPASRPPTPPPASRSSGPIRPPRSRASTPSTARCAVH